MATLKDKIDVLLAYANDITKKDDAKLGDAIKSLADGYGQGGEYLDCEWIKSNGGYIATGFAPTNHTIEVKAVALGGNYYYMFGDADIASGHVDSDLAVSYVNNTNLRFSAIGVGSRISVSTNGQSLSSGQPFIVTVNPDLRLNGEVLREFSQVSSNRKINLFLAVYYGGFLTDTGTGICYFKATNNNTGEVDIHLIPRIRIKDGAAGMYDLVSGNFIVSGNDKPLSCQLK